MISPDKQTLRKHCLAARQAITADDAQAASRTVTQHLLALLEGASRVIAGYVAVRGELDINLAMAMLHKAGHRLCLPVVEAADKPLLFRQWLPDKVLIAGTYNIPVPDDAATLLTPDTLIVPLVGFDWAGHRLGYGAGYYDRTIQSLREAKKRTTMIGIGYAVQQVDAIPALPHDEKLDVIVTEKAILTP